MDTPPTSEILRSLATLDAEYVSLGTVMATFGSRAHAMALLLLSLPEALPLPIPSASAILGIPLVLIAAHLTVFGEGRGLPIRVRNLQMPVRIFRFLERYVAPVLERTERFSRPRWQVLARRERAIGVVCLYLTIVLLLPIPFVNSAPAICLALISWGMIQRDGGVVFAGFAGTAAMTVSLVFLADWAFEMFSSPGTSG